MTVQNIHAVIECDGCGKEFLVELDAGETNTTRIGEWALHDVAMDAVREGSNFVRYTRDTRWGRVKHISTTMVFEQDCFCPECTSKLTPEDKKTIDGIRERLGL